MIMKNFTLAALSAAVCLTFSAAAIAAPMSKTEYSLGKDGISAKYKTDKAACQPMSGNAKDICVEEAKSREKVAKAELEASYEPSEKHNYEVRMARADAAYDVAKEKCDDAAGNAKDVCVKEAKAAHVTAKADAKVVEKTNDANTSAHEKTTAVRKDAASDKRDAAYAVAKEKCDALAGDPKAACIKEAKARNGQM
jgi:hypothetical protein